jgi:predicted secreted protein
MSPSRMLRVVAAFLLAVFILVRPAFAGDSAQLNVIGYSEDGRVFAFEEYGVLDGSGFAYSNYFFLDTKADKFIDGTPIRVMIENETSVAKIRAIARGKAAPFIKQYDLENNPGYVVAYNPVSEAESDPHRIRYHGFPISPPLPQTYTMELVEKAFPVTKECLNMTGTFSGFSLAFTEDGGKAAQVIYEDKQVPSSRKCPNGYRLGAIIVGDWEAMPTMAMISVSSFGFEGNDERWIAVPVRKTGQK